jgi:hypothetical protein
VTQQRGALGDGEVVDVVVQGREVEFGARRARAHVAHLDGDGSQPPARDVPARERGGVVLQLEAERVSPSSDPPRA